MDGITALKAATAWRLNLVMLSLIGPAGPAATQRPVRSGRLEAGLAARRARSDGRELEPEANQS